MKYTILLIAPLILACGTMSAITTPTPQATQPSASAEPSAEPTQQPAWTVCTDTLNVRAGAGTAYAVHRHLKAGASVTPRRWTPDGWAMIETGEWVNGDYLCRP